MPTDPGPELARLTLERHRLQTELHELQTGTGRYEHTETGYAARQLPEARRELDRAAGAARSPALSRRQRRKAEAHVEDQRAEFNAAAQQWRATGHQLEHDLAAAIEDLDETVDSLDVHRHQHAFWQLEHPATARRLEALDRQMHALEQRAGIPTAEPAHRPPPAMGGLSR